MLIRINTLSEINKAAKEFVKQMGTSKIFAFYGEMGVGKTTFVKEICKELKVVDVVNSPTFSIVNEYKTENDKTLFHLDLYRVNEPEELFDLGYEDYIYSDNLCFIEWPEIMEALLPQDYVSVLIEKKADESREIRFLERNFEK